MKQIIYILWLLSLGQLCFGQEKSFYVPTYGNDDTTLWFKLQQEKFGKAGLKNLTNATDTLHFRFSSEIQAIDIWTTNYLTFSGILTNFTTSYDPNGHERKNPKEEKFYSKVNKLDTNIVRQIYEVFNEKAIFDIPPQDSIKDWNDGLDGITYFVEYSTFSSYLFKDYWTPSAFKDKVDEAKRFYELTQRLEELLNLHQSFEQFISSLPYGTYKAGGILIITTSKKKRK